MDPNPQTAALMQVVLGFLKPLLMAGGIADADVAGMAAEEAITERTRMGETGLVRIAQQVGLDFASLDNLRLSVAEDVPLPMKLRLRTSAGVRGTGRRPARANAASRAEVQTEPDAHPRFDPDPNPGSGLQLEPEPVGEHGYPPDALNAILQARGLVDQARLSPAAARAGELSWAAAMTDVAAEMSSEIGTLPPAQRRVQLIKIGALIETARCLGHKSQLLGTTALGRVPIGGDPTAGTTDPG